MPSAKVHVLLGDRTPGTKAASLLLKPGTNLITGRAAFERHFGEPTSLENDLLVFAAAVYAADVATMRGDREAYSRNFDIEIPVVNHHALNALKNKIRLCLAILSGDAWNIHFVRAAGSPEEKIPWNETEGSVLLFSGGLDSLAKAVDLAHRRHPTALVSHDSGNRVTATAQRALLAHIHTMAESAQYPHLEFRVRGQRHASWGYSSDREPSQRTRSFLFLTLGALVARRQGLRRVLFMAENGQMAIHVPLTAARIGAFSTRTAHPEVLSLLQEIFSNLLDCDLTIDNPYLYRTKGEVVRDLCSPEHLVAVRESVSCWMSSRLVGSASHCGACVPCLVRRIALEHHGLPESTDWERDLLGEEIAKLDMSDDGKKNLMEIVELVTSFEKLEDSELILEYPELINRHFDAAHAIEMYRRFSCEARAVLSAYPNVRQVM